MLPKVQSLVMMSWHRHFPGKKTEAGSWKAAIVNI